MEQLRTPGHDSVVRGADGRMLLRDVDLVRAAAGDAVGTIRWLMRVDWFDPQIPDGSSFCGEEIRRGTTYVRPGAYVCHVALKDVYIAFHVDSDGWVWSQGLVPADQDDWPVRLWPALRASAVPDRSH